MFRAAAVILLLGLAGCQQSGNGAAVVKNASAPAVPDPAPAPPAPSTPPVQTPVPVSYDWSFYARGGVGDLFFGDGDWSNEEFILSLTCRGGSGKTGLSLQGEPDMPARLIAGDQQVAVLNGGELPVDHAVLQAFAANRSLRVIAGATERDLAAKPGAGIVAIESFFAYCAGG